MPWITCVQEQWLVIASLYLIIEIEFVTIHVFFNFDRLAKENEKLEKEVASEKENAGRWVKNSHNILVQYIDSSLSNLVLLKNNK